MKIGNITIKNNLILAPMAGTSNYAYMKICEEIGVGYAITELMSAESIVRENKKTFDMLKGLDRLNIPFAIQIFGSNAKVISDAAIIINKMYPMSIIDINMGCPVPKVSLRSQAGASLLKDPKKVFDIVSTVVKSVNVPVTVKIRSGWDHNSINAVEIAKVCESAGASLITIHGRTRSDGYSGNVDLDIIKKVKEAVNIPVAGNGDIKDIYSAKHMLDETGVDYLMIGRKALGNPWIFREINKYLETGEIIPKPTEKEKIDMAIKHINYLREVKNDRQVLLESRTNLSFYLKGMNRSSEIKNKIYTLTDIFDIIKLLENYKEDL